MPKRYFQKSISYNKTIQLSDKYKMQENPDYYEETQKDCNQLIDIVQNSYPAMELTNKQYSLQADIITGWRPKMKILGPIPFNCDSPFLDEIIEELSSFGRRYKQRLIYLGKLGSNQGYRYQSSFKMHQQMKRSYNFKYQSSINTNYMHMAAYFRKFHANFKAKYTRIFRGMNPTVKQSEQLLFESNFESGNLDAVIKVGQNQYDLFIRIDTNTRGHLQWFNFTVKNCGKKKVKFNIVNFKKAKTLYQRGMKPYIFSQHLKQTKQLNWFQGGENIRYSRRKLTYEFLDGQYQEDQITFNCLQFQYTFDVDWQIVQFAYSPPFTYTQTIEMIRKLKQIAAIQLQINQKQSFFKEEVLCDTLGGIEVPLLTITDPQIQNKKKKCILVSGRIHPGETCASYMGKGFLQYICSDSQEAKFLRKNIVFKVIPMINPDGVIVGNFRTSLCGRDLNRAFKTYNDLLIPQVKALKQLVIKLKNEYKNRIIFFLDLHGHSVKKNVFLYGPEYDIWQTNYYKTRIFPKLLSVKTDIFRYYSCLFRIAEFKKATARAIILKNVAHCYTIEASTGFYYCPVEKKDIPFSPQKWIFMGRMIAQSIKDYLDIIYEQEIIKIQRKQKITSLKAMKNNRNQSKRHSDKLSSNKFQTRIITNSLNQKNKVGEDQVQKNIDDQDDGMSRKALDIIELIKNDQKKHQEEKINQQDKDGDGHESDDFSQGGSDSEPQDDIPEEEMKKLHEEIFDSIQNYRDVFLHKQKGERQYSVKEPIKKKKIIQPQQRQKSKKEHRGVELIASLRKKAQNLQKARQVLIWNRIKDEFKQLNKKKQEEVNPRNTITGAQNFKKSFLKFKSRCTFGVASETIQKQDAIFGSLNSRFSK